MDTVRVGVSEPVWLPEVEAVLEGDLDGVAVADSDSEPVVVYELLSVCVGERVPVADCEKEPEAEVVCDGDSVTEADCEKVVEALVVPESLRVPVGDRLGEPVAEPDADAEVDGLGVAEALPLAEDEGLALLVLDSETDVVGEVVVRRHVVEHRGDFVRLLFQGGPGHWRSA